MLGSLTKTALVALCIYGVAGLGTALALGPADAADSGDLAPTDLERLNVGSSAPDFTLEDEKGNAITLSQFRGQKNVVLVFYRGHW